MDSEPSPDVVVAAYLDAVTLREYRGDPYKQQYNLDDLQYVALRWALDDPTSIEGLRDADAYGRCRILVRLAVWLDRIPATTLPPDTRSRAARTRFLVWTLPLRLRALNLDDDVLPEGVDLPGGAGEFQLTEERLLELARTAREDWLGHLNSWEDDPWLLPLHDADDGRFEHQLLWLTETWPGNHWSSSTALSLPAAGDDHAADVRRVAADIAEKHWLPNSSPLGAARALFPGSWRRRLPLVVLPLGPLVVVALVVTGQMAQARYAAAALLLTGLLVAVLVPRRIDMLLLLRLPAAAGAGTMALLGLTARWWLTGDGWRVGIGLLAVAAGYLAIEARLHGTTRPRAVLRAALVFSIGALFAFVLSVAVLGFVIPQIGDHGQCLIGWWTHDPWKPLPWPAGGVAATCSQDLHAPAAARPIATLTLMTGWSLAVGIALQVLWNDQPITSPLGRLRRTRGPKT